MKRVLALTLAVTILFAFTGCTASDYKKALKTYQSGDYITAEELFAALGDYKDSEEYMVKSQEAAITEMLPGTWEAMSIDFAEYFQQMIEAYGDEDVQAALDYCHFSKQDLTIQLVFSENGQAQFSLDEAAVENALNTVYSEFLEGMKKYVEDTLNEPVQSIADALATVIKVLNIDFSVPAELFGGLGKMAGDLTGLSLEEIVNYLELAKGLLKIDSLGAVAVKLLQGKIDDFCADQFPVEELQSELKAISSTGTWTVEGNKVLLSFENGTTETAIFDEANKVLGLETTENLTGIYPLRFAKNG